MVNQKVSIYLSSVFLMKYFNTSFTGLSNLWLKSQGPSTVMSSLRKLRGWLGRGWSLACCILPFTS